ncbi:MAG TPA: oxidoreductase [Gemmatimonadaceae bacterium]|jgi:NAD(P)-dependent dehydrogenase (short-subunit alcohol dehydrogenase family)
MPSQTDTALKTEKVWFVTGCSTGFGREIAKMVLDRGYRAVVTARDPAKVEDIAKGRENRALVLELDVTDPVQVEAATKSAEKHFGRIDVLVNNAGIGYFGAVEESDEEEVRRMFEINFFGLSRMTRAVLPIMRGQRGGHIVNISSIGGLRSFPALAYYHATKYAVEGFSESLALEVAPLGIKVTIVEPSGFRTDWAGRSAKERTTPIADYAETAGQNLENIREASGRQAGDPVRAAAAIIAAVESPNPPLRLLLGKAALNGARGKLEALKRDFDAWEKTTVAADFPDA